MIPPVLWPHITSDEITLLTEDEISMLLYICNVMFPISLPTPSEEDPHPITLNLIKSSKRHFIVDKIKKSEPEIKEEFKEILNGLKTKLNIP
jgi:hypothetical protein